MNPVDHKYLKDIEHREEGGTPAIVESIRAGLAFQLKQAVGADTIRKLEDHSDREDAITLLRRLDGGYASLSTWWRGTGRAP